MSNQEFLLLIVLMTIGTVVGRGFFFLFSHSARMPDWVQHALSFVPAVALAAILAPDLLLSGGVLVEPWNNIRLLAGIAAVLFSSRRVICWEHWSLAWLVLRCCACSAEQRAGDSAMLVWQRSRRVWPAVK